MRVTHSLLHTDDLARLVEREYAVAAPVTVCLLNRGFNDSYLVTDVEGGRRVLRVYNRDKYWIRSESDLHVELDVVHGRRQARNDHFGEFVTAATRTSGRR